MRYSKRESLAKVESSALEKVSESLAVRRMRKKFYWDLVELLCKFEGLGDDALIQLSVDAFCDVQRAKKHG